MSVALEPPALFQGVLIEKDNLELRANAIMHYACITLLTIGYGEFIPVVPGVQKASILVGLAGQIYLVFNTTVLIGKDMQLSSKDF